MSKNSYIQMTTSKLVHAMQRGDADARTEAVRRCTKPAGTLKAKNLRALEAAIVAMDTGRPVPHRSTTLKRTTQVPAARTRVPDTLPADAVWIDDVLVRQGG